MPTGNSQHSEIEEAEMGDRLSQIWRGTSLWHEEKWEGQREGESKARGYAYAKIEYVSVRTYLSKNRIRI